MKHGFCIRVWGDGALFTRPECKGERVSYDCPTPSAMRGVIESVFYHPGLRVRIDSITVLRPIRFGAIRRNEVGAVAKLGVVKTVMRTGEAYGINAVSERQQRASVYLQDVDYLVDFHFDLVPGKMNATDSEEKFYCIFLRRLRRGQAFGTPYLGTREFPAHIALIEGERPESCYKDLPELDLGFMLYDMDYGQDTATPVFFHAFMRGGVIETEVPL